MNNKGFAITTILYGMLLLFLMLIISLLGILSTYRSRLEKLQEGANGAREIIYSRYNVKIECTEYKNGYFDNV